LLKEKRNIEKRGKKNSFSEGFSPKLENWTDKKAQENLLKNIT
jgi:hypothetical protein